MTLSTLVLPPIREGDATVAAVDAALFCILMLFFFLQRSSSVS